MKAFERIVNTTAGEQRTDFWLEAETLTMLFMEATSVEVQGQNLVLTNKNGWAITIATNVGSLVTKDCATFYFRVEKVGALYTRQQGKDLKGIEVKIL